MMCRYSDWWAKSGSLSGQTLGIGMEFSPTSTTIIFEHLFIEFQHCLCKSLFTWPGLESDLAAFWVHLVQRAQRTLMKRCCTGSTALKV